MRNPIAVRVLGLLILLSISGVDSARAQMTQAWLAIDTGSFVAEPMTVDASGFVYEAPIAATSGLYQPPFTIRVTKRGPDGSLVWSSDFTDPAHHDNFAQVIAVDTDGSVYAAGGFDSIAGTPPSWVTTWTFGVVKYDANGTLAWSRAPFPGLVDAMVLDHNGGVYLCGEDTTAQTRVVVKYSTAGQPVWTAPLPVMNRCFASMPSATRLFVGGTATITGPQDTDFFVARFDPSTGAIAWSRTLDGGTSEDDLLGGIAADTAGNVAVCGSFTNAGVPGVAVALYDDLGNLHWSHRLVPVPGSTSGEGSRVALDTNGRVVIAGVVTKPPPDHTDVVLALLDHTGNVAWQNTIDHGWDVVAGLCVDAAGVVSVIGNLTGNNPNLTPVQAFAERYDSSGNLIWSLLQPAMPASGFDSFSFSALAPMAGGSIVIGGGTEVSLTGNGFVERFDSQPTGFCFGDGSGTACPCGNASSPSEQAGCASSLGVGGKLTSSGSAEIGNDSLTLLGTNMPNASALYFQGTTQVSGGAGNVLGDGLRCAGGTNTRLGTKTNASGASQYPSASDPTLSLRGGVTSPGTRTYQAWYRNAAPFCTSATFNLTNGLLVTWSP